VGLPAALLLPLLLLVLLGFVVGVLPVSLLLPGCAAAVEGAAAAVEGLFEAARPMSDTAALRTSAAMLLSWA
jgi:hypothetical protein